MYVPLIPYIASSDVSFHLDEHFSHPSFSGYNLRIKEPKLCDPSVLQYSGYLDIAEDKHIFFWFLANDFLTEILTDILN